MFNESELASRNGTSATIVIADWIKLYLISLLNFIPIIGSIAAIVIYCVIGFSDATAKSMSSMIKAMLLIAVISLVIGLFIAIIFGSIFWTAFSTIQR